MKDCAHGMHCDIPCLIAFTEPRDGQEVPHFSVRRKWLAVSDQSYDDQMRGP